jgi:hypothetical protein
MNRLIDFMAMTRFQSDAKYQNYLGWLSGQIEASFAGQKQVSINGKKV